MPGRPGATYIQIGSVLDDYQWHDLAVTRYMRNISVKLDQVVDEQSRSAFNGLDLDGKVLIQKKQTVAIVYLFAFSCILAAHLITWNVAYQFDQISKDV